MTLTQTLHHLRNRTCSSAQSTDAASSYSGLACASCFEISRLFAKSLLCAGILLTSAFSAGSLAATNSLVAKENSHYQIIDTGIADIGSDYHNSIQILNNRFRVDGDITEITIVFFRSFGSAPIVLVRPDGSKLYIENDADDDSFNWYETDTYDMISLTRPMPGPWQAVGDILPQSRVMVIAGIELNAQAIPELVFSGETIKQTARLENIGSSVDISLFRDVVSLSIEFISTNNPDFSNFGLGSRQIARFEDNGLGFDEFEADGIMTGEFNLNVTEGEWRPIFTVKTPLFSREQINDNIILRPTPVTVSHQEEAGENAQHLVTISVDEAYIDPSSVVVNGSVRHPSANIEKFTMTDKSNTPKELVVANNEYGIYKVNMTVFATTLSGREIVLNVPEYSFVTSAPEIVPQPSALSDTDMQGPSDSELLTQPLIDPQLAQNPPWIFIAIMVNGSILLFGSLLIVMLVSRRNNPHNHLWLRLSAQCRTLLTRVKLPTIISTILSKKAKQKNQKLKCKLLMGKRTGKYKPIIPTSAARKVSNKPIVCKKRLTPQSCHRIICAAMG